jgi:bacillaene synthase trans-acting acyltransferase
MPRTIFMFSGQGAQYYQMGRELHQNNTTFRHVMDRCDEVAGDIGGRTISEIIYGRPLGDSENFDRLGESNAALLAIGYALATTLHDAGVVPDRLLGYSLGETIAAVFGGALSLENGFRLVLGQARLFEQRAPAGAMVAVLADPARVMRIPEIMAYCDIAAVNSPKHSVVSLLARDLPAVRSALDGQAITWARLPIRFPFHSATIDSLAEDIQSLAETFQFSTSFWPTVSVATCGVVECFDAGHLWKVMRGPIMFRETIEALAKEGEWVLVEAGPSGTLAAFARQIAARGITAWPAVDQFGQNATTMRQVVEVAT